MCLSRKFRDDEAEKAIAGKSLDKNGFITLWKCMACEKIRTKVKYIPAIFRDKPYNVSRLGYVNADIYHWVRTGESNWWTDLRKVCLPYKYKAGFHCYSSKEDVSGFWFDVRKTRIKVKVRPEWVTAVGQENGNNVFVCNRMKIIGKA